MKISVSDVKNLSSVAYKWLAIHEEPCICLLHGEMGSGKTTLIKELCKALGTEDVTSSPTFSLVNEYSTKEGVPIFHFDLYRLKSSEELYDFGFEEYLDTAAYTFIEWPEIGNSFYDENVAVIKIIKTGSERIFEFT